MKKIIIAGFLAAIIIAVFISPFASKHPDGLEKVAEDKGFLQKSEGKTLFSAPVPDYTMPGIKHETIAGSIAGATGVILVFALAYGIGFCVKKRDTNSAN